MTYGNDPNPDKRTMRDMDRSNTGMWIAGLIAVCLVIGLVAFATTRSTDTAMDSSRPATSTTGSGGSSGTSTPAQPTKPAPSTPAAPQKQ
jgi:hypothetical protein